MRTTAIMITTKTSSPRPGILALVAGAGIPDVDRQGLGLRLAPRVFDDHLANGSNCQNQRGYAQCENQVIGSLFLLVWVPRHIDGEEHHECRANRTGGFETTVEQFGD